MTSLDSVLPGARSTTTPDRIFSVIKEAIVEGDILAGSKISEPELARAYGISRGTLREAIGRLQACRAWWSGVRMWAHASSPSAVVS